jgi:hypothetical protein
MFHVAALTVVLVAISAAPKSHRNITFDDVTYSRQFVGNMNPGGLAEYVRSGETVDNWTTLVAVRNFPKLDDPSRAAAQLVETLKTSNPAARFQLLVKEDESEAMVDFITWPKDGAYSEFDVFRYLKRPGYAGLIAYQFAYRFTDTGPEATERIKQDRQRWVEAMSRADFPIDFSK